MECVAYMRVSTEKQAEEGNGLDSQKRDIVNFAGKNEFVIKEWYVDDGYTGSNMNRPALQRLINDCYNGKVKNIIAFKLDRLSRNMIDGLYLIEKIFMPNGVNFKCVHDSVNYDSPMEQAYTQMMAVFSQLDKNTMLLRMRGGMLERVKQGYWMGGGNLPYCYSYDKEDGILKPIPERKEEANKAIRLYIDGWTDKRIQECFGYATECTVRNILTSPVNIGMIPYKGELYKGLHEPIFDIDIFEMAQKVRKERSKKRITTRNVHLLSGLCYCGYCGCAMRYQKWGSKGYRIYCCSRTKDNYYLPNYNDDCKNTLHWSDEIEKEVESKILDISLNIKMEDFEKKEDKVCVLEKQLENVKSKLKRLYGIYADGNDTVVEMITDYEKEIERIKQGIIEEQEKKGNTKDKIIQYENIKKIADIWENVSNQDKNMILKSIVEKITIVNGDIAIYLKDF